MSSSQRALPYHGTKTPEDGFYCSGLRPFRFVIVFDDTFSVRNSNNICHRKAHAVRTKACATIVVFPELIEMKRLLVFASALALAAPLAAANVGGRVNFIMKKGAFAGALPGWGLGTLPLRFMRTIHRTQYLLPHEFPADPQQAPRACP